MHEARLEVVLGQRADGAHAVDVLGRLLHDHVDDVVVRDDADQPAVVVEDGHGQQVVAGDLLGHLLAVVGDLDADGVVSMTLRRSACRGARIRSRSDTTPSSLR